MAKEILHGIVYALMQRKVGSRIMLLPNEVVQHTVSSIDELIKFMNEAPPGWVLFKCDVKGALS